jgi:hypothetical protein
MSEKTDRMPLWLLTCKQLLAEAVEEFNFEGIWVFRAEMSPHLMDIRSLLSPGEAQRLGFVSVLDHDTFSAADSSYKMILEDEDHLAYALQFIEKAGNAKELSIQYLICSFNEFDANLAGINRATLANYRVEKFTVSLDYCCGKPIAAFKGRCSGEVKKLGSLVMAADVAPVVEEDGNEVKFTVTRPRSSS